ncbi:MAG: cytochrome c oxidase subunit 4 [Cellulomonas sp.]
MKIEARFFLFLAPFFLIETAIYGLWSRGEMIGTLALLVVALLVSMIGGYLALLSRRIDARPEDDPYAEIEQGAGDQGVFSPWSWWPLAIALAAAIFFAGLAIGWWLVYIGAAFGVIALIGWVFEFSRGQHAH